jgi:pentatricopeptide repeat protein
MRERLPTTRLRACPSLRSGLATRQAPGFCRLGVDSDSQCSEPIRESASDQRLRQLEGVRVAWARVVPHKTFTPDEGLVLSVLAVAARWADPSLSLRALEALAAIGVTAQEHHLTLLLQAYVNAGQLPDAIRVLSAIRAAGFHPTTATAQPIVTALTTADLIDQAFYSVEDMHKAGSSVDITALNAIVEAAVRTGDLPRARATQLAAADVGLVPDEITYNLILEACVTANNRLLGERIISEMRSASLSPNATSYEHMIRLCLQSPEYEAAFFYFEKLKAEAQPRREIYVALFNACQKRDDRRWKLVQEEAQRAGIRLSRRDPSRPQRS